MSSTPTPIQDLTSLTSLFIKNRGGLQQALPSQVSGNPLSIPYPWGPYPYGHIPYDAVGTVSLPAAPSGDIVVPFSTSLIVPNGSDGVIEQYSLNFMGGGFV